MNKQFLIDLVTEIEPLDVEESKVKQETLQWMQATDDMFRIEKPDKPAKHWIAYGVCLDTQKKKLLLGHHVKSDLWLPSGGHVEPWEHPQTAARREFEEELFVLPTLFQEKPFFLSSGIVQASGREHEDVALWYLLQADIDRIQDFDSREFHEIAWFTSSSIPDRADPNMPRFLKKLLAAYPELNL
jgi:8-oxo-dGTP pyrophosphatase MutT (NUDIX family)